MARSQIPTKATSTPEELNSYYEDDDEADEPDQLLVPVYTGYLKYKRALHILWRMRRIDGFNGTVSFSEVLTDKIVSEWGGDYLEELDYFSYASLAFLTEINTWISQPKQ